jgi:hypothetical protein
MYLLILQAKEEDLLHERQSFPVATLGVIAVGKAALGATGGGTVHA